MDGRHSSFSPIDEDSKWQVQNSQKKEQAQFQKNHITLLNCTIAVSNKLTLYTEIHTRLHFFKQTHRRGKNEGILMLQT